MWCDSYFIYNEECNVVWKLLYLQCVEWGANATVFTLRTELGFHICCIYSEELNSVQQLWEYSEEWNRVRQLRLYSEEWNGLWRLLYKSDGWNRVQKQFYLQWVVE